MITKILLKLYCSLHRYLHRSNALPLSRNFGVERGTPVGRYYVEQFIQSNCNDVQGDFLEFGATARYKKYFNNYDTYDTISVLNEQGITYIADIHNIDELPDKKFDCIVCTQVFEHLKNPESAAKSLYFLLKEDGILLFTAPFINNVHGCPNDYRRFTLDGCRLILEGAGFVIDQIDFGGNCMVSTGSLLGMVVEDFTAQDLDLKDSVYPYNILIRAVRSKSHVHIGATTPCED